MKYHNYCFYVKIIPALNYFTINILLVFYDRFGHLQNIIVRHIDYVISF